MKTFLKLIATVVDYLIVTMEHATKGRKRSFSKKLDLAEYNRREYFKHPEKFYALGLKMPDMKITPIHTKGGIRVSRYEFKSEIESGYPENDVAPGRIFEARKEIHGDGAPCAIIIHGWREPGTFTFYNYMLGWSLARLGINCIFFNQPYHGPRKPPGSADGDLMLSGDMEQTVLAFRQSVCDVRSLITWTRSNFSGPVGVVGFSLGGFITFITSCVDDRISFAIPIIAAGDLTTGIEKSFVAKTIIRDLKNSGLTAEQVTANWRIIMPVNLEPKLPPERIEIIAGQYDLLIPAKKVNEIWERWNHPQIKWFPGGHITIGLFPRLLVNSIFEFIMKWATVKDR
jgi:hypothetical protein